AYRGGGAGCLRTRAAAGFQPSRRPAECHTDAPYRRRHPGCPRNQDARALRQYRGVLSGAAATQRDSAMTAMPPSVPPSGAYIVIVVFEIRAGDFDGFLSLVKENAQASLDLEPGCRQF